MRGTLALIMMTLLVSAAWGDLTGSEIVFTEPSGPVSEFAPVAVAFDFMVHKDSASTEPIVGIWLEFPYELSPQEHSMSYEEIEPGRPAFACTVQARTALWLAEIGSTDGIRMGESMRAGVDAISYIGFPDGWAQVDWWLAGGWGNDVGGQFAVYTTPVDDSSWGRIKTLYRESRGGLPD
jgi:hypothetical protein